MARYLGLSDVGTFGLALGVVGIMPALTGFGLNYFLSRDVVDAPLAVAGRRIRDRLCVTAAVCALLGSGALLWQASEAAVAGLPAAFIFIIVLEIIAQDIHMGLIGLRMAVLAGLLVFIRSASWVFIYILVSLHDPALRSLGYVFKFWLAALIVNFLFLAVHLRNWPWRAIAVQKLDIDWLLAKIRGGWKIYASDIALAGSLYIDRFVVNHLEGLELTGVYMFFWSVANSSQALITTSISQVALPRLVAAYRDAGEVQWRRSLAAEVLKVFLSGSVVATIAFFCIERALPFVHRASLNPFLFLFFVMLFASVVRMTSDILNYGLYSRGQDAAYAGTNIAGFIISPIATVIVLETWGFGAVGYGMIATATFLLVVRLGMLANLHKSELSGNYDAPGI